MSKRIPLFGVGVKSVSSNITAQRRVNCFFEITGQGEKQQVAIRGTPGLTLFVSLPTFPIRGFVQAGNYLYVTAGNTVYQVCQNGGYLVIGTIGNSAAVNPVGMAINETQVMIVDGIAGYVFNYNLINVGNTTLVNNLINNSITLTQICNLTGNQ